MWTAELPSHSATIGGTDLAKIALNHFMILCLIIQDVSRQ
jgi:hypothetical protein